MAKRYINIWYNPLTKRLQDEDGYNLKVADYEGATLDEKPMMHLQLVRDSSNNPYLGLSDLDTPSASIDTDFDPTTNLLTKTYAADINQPGDWKDGGNALASLGQFSIPIDMNKAEVGNRLGKQMKLDLSKFELKILENITADFVFKVIFPFNVYNLQDNNGTVGPAPEDDYYDKTEVDALIPTVDPKMVADIDMTATGDYLVYTVGAGYLCKPEFADLIITAISGAGTLPEYRWVVNTPEDHELAPEIASRALLVGEFDSVEVDPGKYWPAGTTFRLVVTTASTYSSHVMKAIIKGVFADV